MFKIRLAQTQQELDDLYRFRYRIYVEEMGRLQHDADHKQKMIKETSFPYSNYFTCPHVCCCLRTS